METFEKLFDGKRSDLNKNLSVNITFLDVLEDTKLLTPEQRATIQSKPTAFDKADELLTILKRADNKKIGSFYSALRHSGQSHIITEILNMDNSGNNLRRRPLSEDTHNSGRVSLHEDPPSVAFTGFRCSGSRIIKVAVVVVGLVALISIGSVMYKSPNSGNDNSAADASRAAGGSRATSGRSFRDMFQGRRSELVKDIDISHGMWLALKDKNLLTEWQIKDCQSKETEFDQVSKMLELLEKKEDSLIPVFCKALVQTENTNVISKFFKDICV